MDGEGGVLKKIIQRFKELFCRHAILKWKAGTECWEGTCVGRGKLYEGRVINQISLGIDPTEGFDA